MKNEINVTGSGNFVIQGGSGTRITVTNQETVGSLIGKGRLREAINLLPEGSDKILLLGRLSRLEKQEMLGTIDTKDANIERNRIVAAALNYAGEEMVVSQKPIEQPQQSPTETQLLAVITENKRRKPEIAEKATLLLGEYQGYMNNKQTDPTHDVTGRRLKDIMNRISTFFEEIKEGKLDSKQEIVDRVNFLISEPVPNYDHLNEAYKLLQGRGFKSEYFDRNLHNRPDDNEVRITMAEMIEQQLARL